MKILALEFSSERRSVAVLDTVGSRSCELYSSPFIAGSPNEGPLALIEMVLSRTPMEREEIDSIAIGTGPGSFAGIRGAISIAIGWQFAQQVNVFPVSGFEILVFQMQQEGFRGALHVAMDAQRSEFYHASYFISETEVILQTPLVIATAEMVREQTIQGTKLIGPGIKKFFAEASDLFPSALAMAHMAQHRPSSQEELRPISLRETTFVKAPAPRRVEPDLK